MFSTKNCCCFFFWRIPSFNRYTVIHFFPLDRECGLFLLLVLLCIYAFFFQDWFEYNLTKVVFAHFAKKKELCLKIKD